MRWLNLPPDGDVGAQCHLLPGEAASCGCRLSPHSKSVAVCPSRRSVVVENKFTAPRTKLFFGFLFQCVSDFNLPNNNFPSLVFSLSWAPRKSKRNNRKKKSLKKLFERRQQPSSNWPPTFPVQSDPPVLSRVISAHRNKRRQTIEPNWFVRHFLASY